MTSRSHAGRWVRPAAATLAAGLLLAGCVGAPAGAGDTGRPGEAVGVVTVLAAASLTEVFTELGGGFERRHPDAQVVFSFAGSSALATQVVEGAPADVYASASLATMDTVTAAGEAAGAPEVFARNGIAIAVAAGNPHGLTGLTDLADPELAVAMCAPQVPCGGAAQRALAAADVALTPVTLERDVKAALSKVTLGEVDAALVYRTDLAAAGDAVDAVALPGAVAARATNDYAAVALAGAPNPDGAAAFVAYVRSAEAAGVLAAAGFEVP